MAPSTRRTARVTHRETGGAPLPSAQQNLYGENDELAESKKHTIALENDNNRKNSELYNEMFSLSGGHVHTQGSLEPRPQPNPVGLALNNLRMPSLNQLQSTKGGGQGNRSNMSVPAGPPRQSTGSNPQTHSRFNDDSDPWNLRDEVGNRNLYPTGVQIPYQTPYNDRRHPSEPANSLASKWGMAGGRPSPVPLSTRSFRHEDQLYNTADIHSPSIQPPPPRQKEPTQPQTRQYSSENQLTDNSNFSPNGDRSPLPTGNDKPLPSGMGDLATRINGDPSSSRRENEPSPPKEDNNILPQAPRGPSPGESSPARTDTYPSSDSPIQHLSQRGSGISETSSSPPKGPSSPLNGAETSPSAAPTNSDHPRNSNSPLPDPVPKAADQDFANGSHSQRSHSRQDSQSPTQRGPNIATTDSRDFPQSTSLSPDASSLDQKNGRQSLQNPTALLISKPSNQNSRNNNEHSLRQESQPSLPPTVQPRLRASGEAPVASPTSNGDNPGLSPRFINTIRDRMIPIKPRTGEVPKPFTGRDILSNEQKQNAEILRKRMQVDQRPISKAPAWQKPQPPIYPLLATNDDSATPIPGFDSGNANPSSTRGNASIETSPRIDHEVPPRSIPQVGPSLVSRVLDIGRYVMVWMQNAAKKSWLWVLLAVLIPFLATRMHPGTGGTPLNHILPRGFSLPSSSTFSIPFWGSCCADGRLDDVFRRLDGIDTDIGIIHRDISLLNNGVKAPKDGRLLFWVNQSKDGKLVIPQEYYEAIKQQILKDKQLLKDVSNETWSPIITRLVADGYLKRNPRGNHLGFEDITTADIHAGFEEWLRQNDAATVRALRGALDSVTGLSEMELRNFLAKHNIGLTDGQVVTRKEFEELYKNEISGGYAGNLRGLAEQVDQFKKELEANPPQGLSKEDVEKVVEATVRKYVDAIKVEAAAKAGSASVLKQLDNQINYFSPATGARVDPNHTSRKWEPTKPVAGTKQWYDKDGYEPQPPISALMPWQEDGQCFCAGPNLRGQGAGTANLSVLISRDIVPQFVVLEHILPGATLDAGARPRDVEIWASYEDYDLLRTVAAWSYGRWPATAKETTLHSGYVKIGEFTYEDHKVGSGAQLYKLSSDLVEMNAATSSFVVRALNNYGADHTCFYRIRLYGDQRDGDLGS